MQKFINDAGEVVTAVQLTPDNVTDVSTWSGGNPVMEHDALEYEKTFPALNISTRDGAKRASQGDYVLKGPDGRFDVAKAFQFRRTYREV